MDYAEIWLDVPNRRLDQSFHYSVPESMAIRPGMRVLVPLQQREVQGVVIGVEASLPPDLREVKLRPVLKIIDGEPVMPPELLELARWLAETTICPIAQALHTVWPLLKGKVQDWLKPEIAADDPDMAALELIDPPAFKALRALQRARRGALPLSTLVQRAGCTPETIETLLENGWISRETRLTRAPKAEKSKEEEEESLPDQRIEIETAAAEGAAAGWELTPEQEQAVREIEAVMKEEKSQTMLLYGITGSGKTEVYRRLIHKILAAGGDAILLVPEISLTSQVAGYFTAIFGEQVAVLHSGISAAAKMQAWLQIIHGRKRLVIGARSAVFAPLPHLRLIILDEEHDGAYQQGENPKYHARDVARKRMEQRRGLVLLGSATPSLEAFAAAKSRKIRLSVMEKRVNAAGLPPVEIVDMRAELMQGNRSMFSLPLQAKLRERLERGEQAILLLNRRGYATFVVCRECGFVVRCPNCEVALTYHTQGQAMRCHYCNHTELPPHVCPQCGSRYIRFFGQGTQRVEEDLETLLPGAGILRMDRDTTRSKGAYARILERFRGQEASVLIGTQMIAKGLDFPNVTLVGVVAADQILNMPDFRARERAFQLLTQVAGRAGRSAKPGEVIIQTYLPQDRAVLLAAAHDYPGFFREEIAYRRERKYPPFTHMIQVTLLHEKEERVIRAASELAICLRAAENGQEYSQQPIDILGPAPAVYVRLKNQYRWQVCVKGKELVRLRSFLQLGVGKFYQGAFVQGVRLNIQVDPLSGS
ncbi:MAG: primosomal protein N' [Peptococcaceae bacterium]|nr:primosomal protein N' [Peptococcaceae bacterium]